MAEKYTQDPLAIFLEYQLPDMINEARRTRENRQHEFDMIKAREESSKRLAEFNAELGEEQATNQTKLNLLISDRDRMIKSIETKRDALLKSNINMEEYDLVKDKTEDGEALSTLIKSENLRESIKSLQDFQDLDQGINILNDNLNYLNESLNIIDRISAAQQQGINFAKSVEDFDKNKTINEADFIQLLKNYQDLELKPRFDLSTAEGQLEQLAFLQQIPTLEEKFNYGKTLIDLETRESKQKLTEYKAIKAGIEAEYLQSNGKSMSRFNDELNDASKKAKERNEIAIEKRPDGYGKQVQELIYINRDKKEIPSAISLDNDMQIVEGNIIKLLQFGSKNQIGAGDLKNVVNRYNQATSRTEQRAVLDNFITRLDDDIINLDQLDLGGFTKGTLTEELNAIKSQLYYYKLMSDNIKYLPGYETIYPPNESVEDTRGLQ